MGASVDVRDLRVVAQSDQDEQVLVEGVSFSMRPGEVLALIGESGSGKTTTALALMGYARPGCRIAGGSIRIGEVEVTALDAAAQRRLRGRTVAYIAQSAAASFNPSRTLMDQVVEPVRIHGLMPREEAERKAVALFRELALPEPERIGARYPHQVSGGQLQRLMAAMAMMADPDVIVLDEPTTALDVTTQIEVLGAFRRVVRERQVTAVYVSHDLAVVAQMADHVLVMRHGRPREYARIEQVLEAPAEAYTRELLAAAHPAPRPSALTPEATAERALLEVRELSAGYGKVDAKGRPEQLILHDIELKLWRGQTIGVIGESGSGKSTLARCIAGLIEPCEGYVLFDNRYLARTVAERTRENLRRIQMVFQIADTALNPAQEIGEILARPLRFYFGLRGAPLRQRVAELLDLVKLPAAVAGRRPGGLSGGQKQRINLARALAAQPDLILCDEVTSALDPVVAAAILDLIAELRRELNLACLFISHDLHTVRALCDEVVVMRHGRKLAQVAREDYARGPHHPYYELLARSVPELRRGWLDEVLAQPHHAA
ncbi:ABC transporter ATP-binding protein [Frateuria defendens]|uniref:ABC transporter ATP-binding protein n=1 Tax=Frateuria defendens TaxID=2219559 RepID=UPI00066FE922|nr:ABC transporter ATP-binding protein [Frateuria defendens]